MLTHIVRHIFRTTRPTNFKLGIPMEDDDPHQPQAPWLPRSKVKVARSRDQSVPSWPNAVPVSLAAGGAYRTVSSEPDGHTSLLYLHSYTICRTKYTAEQSLNTTTLHPNFTTRFANWSLGSIIIQRRKFLQALTFSMLFVFEKLHKKSIYDGQVMRSGSDL